MAVTKTNFMNMIRCPRYAALSEIHKDKLNSKMTIEEYKSQEEEEQIREILGSMFDEGDNDLINVSNEHLETMMPYYKEVELLAGRAVKNKFGGKTTYSSDTFTQESFDFSLNGIRYLCYVDIYNENNDEIKIIEVKATTSNKFLKLGYKEDGEFKSIFYKENGIYKLQEMMSDPKKYNTQVRKLEKRFNACGKYVYDLAVQRFILERDFENNKIAKNVKYYLAVLNHEYVFDGKYVDGKAVYSDDIISLFDLTELTSKMQEQIERDRERIEQYITEANKDPYPLGEYCEFKKNTKCKFYPICSKNIPEINSTFNYMGYNHGFKDDDGNKYSAFDLVNDGILKLEDVPDNLLKRKNNQIQKQVVITGQPYFNKDKLKVGLDLIKYPIYHLDFETFPCPMPRFKGEKCYTQSVFQYSLHVEKEPGNCDKNKDHHEFLAGTHDDLRLELVKSMCENIPTDQGTVLVYNQSFEKSRLKELAALFPEYKKHLDGINDNIFDLLYLVKSNKKLYTDLGYNDEEAGLFNYYDKSMSGSFSIKKVLPVFSSLTYKGMEVANGQEALVTYAKFPLMNKKEFAFKYQALLEYCKQDTWAMVEILDELRKLV